MAPPLMNGTNSNMYGKLGVTSPRNLQARRLESTRASNSCCRDAPTYLRDALYTLNLGQTFDAMGQICPGITDAAQEPAIEVPSIAVAAWLLVCFLLVLLHFHLSPLLPTLSAQHFSQGNSTTAIEWHVFGCASRPEDWSLHARGISKLLAWNLRGPA